MLKEVTVLKHRHLVKLLATYEYKGKCHLLFPYAKHNLREYWETHDRALDPETPLWFLHQVLGIASGLHAMHNYKLELSTKDASSPGQLQVPIDQHTRNQKTSKYGRHGDIKADNILWLDDGKHGILQIADFGLGRFHRLESRSGVDPRTLYGSQTYMPPEPDLGTAVSRKYDMWTLGCVYLEFVTWLLEGTTGIKGFAELRDEIALDGANDDKFFTLVEQGQGREAIVRPAVTTKIRNLKGNRLCSELVGRFLILVEERLLVIDPEYRITSKDLEDKLQMIVEEAQNSPQKAFSGRVNGYQGGMQAVSSDLTS